jgi:threonine dehydratase
VREYSAGVILSAEDDLLGAVAQIYAEHAIVVEPSGGAALCGLERVSASGARRIICVLTGSNVAGGSHFEIISRHQPIRHSGKLPPGGESMMS